MIVHAGSRFLQGGEVEISAAFPAGVIGSTVETQDVLGHKRAATTRVYVQRVAVRKDRYSVSIPDRLDV